MNRILEIPVRTVLSTATVVLWPWINYDGTLREALEEIWA